MTWFKPKCFLCGGRGEVYSGNLYAPVGDSYPCPICTQRQPCPHPNKQASTCGFESCPDCGARLEEE